MADDAPATGAAAAPPDPAREPVLYVVATVHLDTQWRWTVRDTIRDFLPATLRDNFPLFERFPRYTLSFEGAFRYRLMREHYPWEYERLKAYAAAGRWCPAGSMLDAPDVNVVSPESLIRHVLYANRFFEAEIGRRPTDLFLPDCFGFSWALPSVAAHCGLAGFSSQKFGNWQGQTPFGVGLWRGPDGHGVVAALRPEGYGEGLDEDLSRAPRWLDALEEQRRVSGLALGLKYVGVGDRGGALDQASVEWIEKSVEGGGPIRVVHAASDRLFRDLTAEQRAALPCHDGELLLPVHGTGCLTSQALLKRRNRRAEQLGDAAERAAAAAAILGGPAYPRAELTDAWERFLWHQMHDDLTGTSIPAAYEITVGDQALALNRFATVLTDSISALAHGLDTRGVGQPLVVFNPLSVERTDPVEITLPRDGDGDATTVRVVDGDGRPAPAQCRRLPDGRRRVVFLASVGPVGVAVYFLDRRGGEDGSAGELRVTERELENARYRVRVDGDGDVASVFDKALGRELLAAPAQLALLRDLSPRWPAWEVRYRDLAAAERDRVGGPAEIEVVERGPARVALEIRRRFGRSRVDQRLSLAAGDAGHRLEWRTEIRWRAFGRLLKAVFPLTASNPRASFDLGLGVVERGNRRPDRYEVPAQQWADLTDRSGEWGTAILDDSSYGWDKPDDSTLRLSLVRSPWTWRKFLHQAVQDHGDHRMSWALVGHAGGWAGSDVVAQAARLNQPLVAFAAPATGGHLGRRFSLLSTGSDEVWVRAFKRAEADDGWVVRLQETAGRDGNPVSVETAAQTLSTTPLDGTEEPLGRTRLGGPLRERLGRFEPRTFRLELGPTVHRLEPAETRPLLLPFDLRASSSNGQPVDFDGAGRSLPAEQMPRQLGGGGLAFALGPPDSANAVRCRGQRLPVPDGAWERVFLLLTAVGGSHCARFSLDGNARELAVRDWCEPLARFRTGRWWRPGPGTLSRQPVAFYATHRHDARGADEPYVFCYLFRTSLPVPPGCRELRLPVEPAIRLFAVTLARGGPDGLAPLSTLYD